MALDFPSSPTNGQTYTGANGQVYAYDGTKWTVALPVGADANGWIRPSDWLELPTVTSSDEKIVILVAVFNNYRNLFGMTCSGAYTVNWGDGTTENFSNGTSAYHEYLYSDTDLDGSLCSRGYKQAIITITPQSGQHLTSINLNKGHNLAGLILGYCSGFLDLVLSASYCTSLSIGGTSVSHTMLERIRLLSTGAVISLSSLFNRCASLVSLDLSGLITTSATSALNMFSYCSSMKTIDLSSFTFSLVTSMSNMFTECESLYSVKMPTTTSLLTTFTNCFYYCYSLRSIDFSRVVTSSLTSMSNVFLNCYTLDRLDLSASTWGGLTTASSAFTGCTSLSSLLFPCPLSFSVINCRFSSDALNALYTSLPTVTGQTITVSNNYGVASDDPTIATAKGWTVTG